MTLDKTLDAILRSECSHLGTSFGSRGGSHVVVAHPSGRKLFSKIESAVEQTIGEAESLRAMGLSINTGEIRNLVPEVHASGKTADDRAYLVTDYLDLKPSIGKAGQKALGTRLAEMHKNGSNKDGRFGFHVATYCGVTFWADQRIGDLVKRIQANQPDAELDELERQMRDKVYPVLLAPLEGKVKPSILHGDLWSGNAGTSVSQQPLQGYSSEPSNSQFQPKPCPYPKYTHASSSYYGHNEAELGIMNMFGGFTQDFFQAYHSVLPKIEPYYDERLRSYELYHQ
ncbi:uncharacterized protein UTRI_04195_B [Ustilago trichophora]|uniref:protein-ribulosamine 3-kinase n=1 Tax=Ustilago trichophora TaxID=86804 RepID=A0A5C3EAQ8_9BASI|nr:uncharacterized protein UTRI_04195_B [Ustilago trichophora]